MFSEIRLFLSLREVLKAFRTTWQSLMKNEIASLALAMTWGICLVLVMMLILGMVGSTALAGQRPGSIISTDVRMDFNRLINVEYEKVISSKLGLYAAPYMGLGLGFTSMGATAGGKYYLQGTAPEGLWIGGFGFVEYVSILGFSVTVFGGGANAGYKYFITDRFTVEGNAGLAYVVGFGFTTVYGINIGIAL